MHTAPNLLEENINITPAVVHPCCFVHNKQDNTSPASLGKQEDISQQRRRGRVGIFLCSTIIHCLGSWQNQKRGRKIKQHPAHASQNR